MSNYRIFVHDFFCFIQKPEGYLYDFSWFFMFYSRSWMFYYMYLKNIHVLLHLKKYIQDFSRFFMFYSRSWTTFMFYHVFHEIFKIFQDYLCFIKDLEWFLVYVILFIKRIHVLSMILMISSRFFRIFQDFSCFIQDLEWYLTTFF